MTVVQPGWRGKAEPGDGGDKFLAVPSTQQRELPHVPTATSLSQGRSSGGFDLPRGKT